MPVYKSKLDYQTPTRVRSIDEGGKDVGYAPMGQEEMVTTSDPNGGNKEIWVGTPTPEPVVETPVSTSQYSRPPVPAEMSPEALIQNKYEAQETMAYANFQRRMLNAGASVDPKSGTTNLAAADEILVNYANASFQNDMADLQNWKRTLKGRLALVDKDNSLSDEQKKLFHSKIIGQAKDAIYIPEMTSSQIQPKEKPLFSDSKYITTAGKMVNKITEGGTVEDAYAVANAELGFGWEERYPQLVDLIRQKTQPQGSAKGGMIRIMGSDGITGTIPADKLEEAKKQDPNLKVL